MKEERWIEDQLALSDAGLAEHLDRVLDFNRRAQEVHFLLFMPYMRGVAGLALFCQHELGWSPGKSMELLAGLSDASTEPSKRLAELAKIALERPSVLEVLDSDEGAWQRLEQVDPHFAESLAGYQRRFGCRALSEDVIDPTLGEKPELVLVMLKGMLSRGYDPDETKQSLAQQRESVAVAARRLLSARPAVAARFEGLLQQASDVYPLREDNSFPTYNAANGLMRLALLELGRRLAEKELIAEAGDVMFLEWPEARKARSPRTSITVRWRRSASASGPGPWRTPAPPATATIPVRRPTCARCRARHGSRWRRSSGSSATMCRRSRRPAAGWWECPPRPAPIGDRCG